MFQHISRGITRHPWTIVFIVVIVTLGLSSFLPSLEFQTDFNDFLPDDELSMANTRVQDYFGTSQLPMFILVEKEQASSTLTVDAIRQLYDLDQKLNDNPYVGGVITLTTFLNSICMIEFGQTIDNCTDEEIRIAIDDLLLDHEQDTLTLFSSDDPNEPIDYTRYPRVSKGSPADSIDIKNAYLQKDDETITFSIEVYDLASFEETLQPTLTKVNVMEWCISFRNKITPVEELDLSYTIAVHIEPEHPVWELGEGLHNNLRSLLTHLRNRELLSTYTMTGVLWVQMPDQPVSFPIPLETANVSIEQNTIHLEVSRKELGTYGIAPRFGSFELPAKLSTFQAGTRYYQQGIFKRPGGLIDINTSSIFQRLNTLQNRPVIGTIASRLLERYSGMSCEELQELSDMMDDSSMFPTTIGLHDLGQSWIVTDIAPDDESSTLDFYLLPYLFEDLQLNAAAFLSQDFETQGTAQATLVIVQLDVIEEAYEDMTRINDELVVNLQEWDARNNAISLKITGELVVSSEINELTTEANEILGPSMFFIIVIILLFAFRRFSYVIFPLLGLLIAMVWLLGAMTLFGFTFSIIAVALIPLLFGLGVDYAVHLYHNYQAELEKGKTPAQAIQRSVYDVGTAIFLAWLTTVIAFMSFLSSNIQPIRDFGILLATGITFMFLVALTFLPTIRYLADRKKQHKSKKSRLPASLQAFSLRKVMGRLSLFVLSHQKTITVLMILITVFFGIGALQLERGFDMDQFVPADNPAMELFDTIAEYFPFASEYQEYILIEGDIATVAALDGIRQTIENMEDDTFIGRNKDNSIKADSIYHIIVEAVNNNNTLIKAFNLDETTYIPDFDDDVRRLYDYLLEGDTFSFPSFEEGEDEQATDEAMAMNEAEMVLYRNQSLYEATIIRYYLDTTFQTDGGNLQADLETLSNEMNNDLVEYGSATAIVTGLSNIQLQNTSQLTSSQIVSTAISILLAALVLIITFRRPILGIITMVPVCISIVWILGTMYYLGYILDILTVMVTSITIGIGIDYAIHATQRFRIVAARTGDINKAVCETIGHTGGALLIGALTTSIAFAILVLAPIPPQQRFGLILSITIIYSFITSVLFLPILLAHWAKWRKKHKGYIVSPGAPKDGLENEKYCDY